MPTEEQLVLQTDDFYDLVRKQSLTRSFPGFAARSTSGGALAVDPEVGSAALLALFPDYEVVLSRWNPGREDHTLRRDDHFMILYLDPGRVHFTVHSTAFNAREVVKDVLRRLEPHRRQDKDDDGVWVDFSYMGRHGVERTTQFLRTPQWDDIRANYPAAVRAPLQALFEVADPWKRGRLIIWHGPPGTGKTYAIRSLMMKWRARFDFVVINDPERLAKEPGYYYEVASESTEMPGRRRHRPSELELADTTDEDDEAPRKRRCLFIMEDCADLILKESRNSHYDKIGKLLNITDGLFGQGREDMFLLTFNEDVNEIDPAFLRPGRCVANLGFPRFAGAEAEGWLKANGVEGSEVDGDATLAEMYERVHRGKSAELAVPGGGNGAKGFGAGRPRSPAVPG